MDNYELKKYLIENQFIDNNCDLSICEINEGINNYIFRVTTNKGNFIIKQFPKSSKTSSIMGDISDRYYYEKEAILYINSIGLSFITPDLIHFDNANNLICMSDLGDNSFNNLIMKKEIKSVSFKYLGKIISKIHNSSMNDDSVRMKFSDNGFQKVKLDYRYFKYIKNKELIEIRDNLISSISKYEKTFIHNDLKLNNILLTDKGNICLIDFEGAYYGDPALDLGYLLAHLFIYYLYCPDNLYKSYFLETWHSYISSFKSFDKVSLEKRIIKHMGFIIIFEMVGVAKNDFYFIDKKDKQIILSKAEKIILDRNISSINQLLDL